MVHPESLGREDAVFGTYCIGIDICKNDAQLYRRIQRLGALSLPCHRIPQKNVTSKSRSPSTVHQYLLGQKDYNSDVQERALREMSCFQQTGSLHNITAASNVCAGAPSFPSPMTSSCIPSYTICSSLGRTYVLPSCRNFYCELSNRLSFQQPRISSMRRSFSPFFFCCKPCGCKHAHDFPRVRG
jgi:hypothetical protein